MIPLTTSLQHFIDLLKDLPALCELGVMKSWQDVRLCDVWSRAAESCHKPQWEKLWMCQNFVLDVKDTVWIPPCCRFCCRGPRFSETPPQTKEPGRPSEKSITEHADEGRVCGAQRSPLCPVCLPSPSSPPQNQFAALNAPKKEQSQIEGPSITNSYGFKVSMQNLQEAKALHEVSCSSGNIFMCSFCTQVYMWRGVCSIFQLSCCCSEQDWDDSQLHPHQTWAQNL